MSGWVDFLSAERSDAERIANEENPHQFWPGIEGKYLPPDKLTLLGQVLMGEAMPSHDFEELVIDDRAWVFAFPDRLVRGLASLPEGEVPGVAAAWQEALGEPGSEKWVSFLGGLCGLARQTVAEGTMLVARHAWDG